MSPTEDYSPEDSLSDNSEELLQRSVVFSTVLHLVRTKNLKQVRCTFLRGFKKKNKKQNRSAHTQQVSTALAPGKEGLSLKEYQHWCPRKGDI